MKAGADALPRERAMKMRSATVRALLPLCATLLFIGIAQAGAISFVASKGKDSNPCSRAKPCRTLQEGVDKASDGGDVVVVDSGFYGNNLSITKSITISATGITAALRSIEIDNAGATVILRGLLLTGKGANAQGITITSAASVHIEDCVIEGFPGSGIRAFQVKLFVAGTASRRNGGYGIDMDGGFGSTSASLVVDSSRFENNESSGIHARFVPASVTRTILSGNTANGMEVNKSDANVAWSTAAHNGGTGFSMLGEQPGSPAELTLERSVSRGNGFSGLALFNDVNDATARISNSVFTENATGIDNGGVVLTRGNNTIAGNDDNLDGNDLNPLTAQ